MLTHQPNTPATHSMTAISAKSSGWLVFSCAVVTLLTGILVVENAFFALVFACSVFVLLLVPKIRTTHALALSLFVGGAFPYDWVLANRVVIDSIPISLIDGTALILLFALFAKTIQERNKDAVAIRGAIHSHFLMIGLGALAIMQVGIGFVNSNQLYAIFQDARIPAYTIVGYFACVALARTPSDFKQIVSVLKIGAVFAALEQYNLSISTALGVSVLRLQSVGDSLTLSQFRDIHINVDSIAIALVVSLTLRLASPHLANHRWENLWLAFCAPAVLLSFTRTTWFSITVALIFLVVMSRSPRLWQAYSIIGISGVLAFALLNSAFSDRFDFAAALQSRAFSITNLESDNSFDTRIQEMNAIVDKVWSTSLLVGAGAGATVDRYVPSYITLRTGDPTFVHNSFGWYLLKGGVVSLGYFVTCLGAFLLFGIHLYNRQKDRVVKALTLAVLGAFVYLLAGSLTGALLTDPEFAQFTGIVMGLISVLGMASSHGIGKDIPLRLGAGT